MRLVISRGPQLIDFLRASLLSILYLALVYTHPMLKLVRHVPLLHLITRINDEALRVVLGQSHRHKGIAE